MFSFVLKESFSKQQVQSFANSLELFKIGYSWGGVTSLVMTYDFSGFKRRATYQHRIVRLNIGLEETSDLITDLETALHTLASVLDSSPSHSAGNYFFPFREYRFFSSISWTNSLLSHYGIIGSYSLIPL